MTDVFEERARELAVKIVDSVHDHSAEYDLVQGWITAFARWSAAEAGGWRETQASINEWIETTFGSAGSNFSVAARANEEMAELLMGLAINDDHPMAVEECADIVIILFRLAQRRGRNLMAEVDRKMQVNRDRKWRLANGHGYHVKGAPAPPAPGASDERALAEEQP